MKLGKLLLSPRAAIAAGGLPWALCACWVAASALPHNPLSPGRSSELQTRSVLPEGWGFFTRDPLEPDIILAQRDATGTWELEPPHASAKNLFGMDRTSRALAVELIRLSASAHATPMTCEGPWRACLESSTPIVVHNDREGPLLCGDVGLVRRAPPPWAWAKLLTPDEMPTEVAVLEVHCENV